MPIKGQGYSNNPEYCVQNTEGSFKFSELCLKFVQNMFLTCFKHVISDVPGYTFISDVVNQLRPMFGGMRPPILEWQNCFKQAAPGGVECAYFSGAGNAIAVIYRSAQCANYNNSGKIGHLVVDSNLNIYASSYLYMGCGGVMSSMYANTPNPLFLLSIVTECIHGVYNITQVSSVPIIPQLNKSTLSKSFSGLDSYGLEAEGFGVVSQPTQLELVLPSGKMAKISF